LTEGDERDTDVDCDEVLETVYWEYGNPAKRANSQEI
jgi:hypothetical protein